MVATRFELLPIVGMQEADAQAATPAGEPPA